MVIIVYDLVYAVCVYNRCLSCWSLCLLGRLLFKLLKLSEKNIDRVVGRVHTGLISAGRVGEREREEGGGTCFVKNGLGRSRDCFLLLPAACREHLHPCRAGKCQQVGTCAHVLSQHLPSLGMTISKCYHRQIFIFGSKKAHYPSSRCHRRCVPVRESSPWFVLPPLLPTHPQKARVFILTKCIVSRHCVQPVYALLLYLLTHAICCPLHACQQLHGDTTNLLHDIHSSWYTLTLTHKPRHLSSTSRARAALGTLSTKIKLSDNT